MASPQIPPEVLEALKKDDKGPTVIGVNVAFAGLALVCVTLRSYARLRIVRHFGLEDWFMVLSMVRHAPCHASHSHARSLCKRRN